MPFTQTYTDLLARIWIPLVFVGVFAFDGLYFRREPFWEETRRLVRSIFFATLTVFAIVSLGKMSGEISRAIVVGTGVISLVLVPLVRFWWKPFLHKRGLGIKKTVLIGDNAWGRLAHLGLFRDHYMGIRVVGEVGLTPQKRETPKNVAGLETLSGQKAPDVPLLGLLPGLKKIVKEHEIRGAVVALPEMRREDLAPIIDHVQKHVLSVYVVPNIAQVNLVNSEPLDQERFRYPAGGDTVHSARSAHRDHRPSCGHRFAGTGLLLPDKDWSGQKALSNPEVQDDGGGGGIETGNGARKKSRPQEGVRGEAEARERPPGHEGREVSPEDQPRRASPDL
jgi:hypothetical protein